MARSPSSTNGSLSRESVDFLRRRVSAFGLLSATLGGIFLGWRTVQIVASGKLELFAMHDFICHAVAVAVYLAMWLLCRAEGRSERLVRWVEGVGFVLACVAYTWMGESMPLMTRPEMTVYGALSLSVFARAAYVPSTARRTALLGVAIGAPFVFMTWRMYLGFDLSWWPDVFPAFDTPPSVESFAALMAGTTAIWWSLSTILSAATSQVIYGLRREVSSSRKLGRYTLEAKLGEGGMGVVYEARHAMLRRPTAVKLLKPERAGERDIRRFEREVQRTAALSHPNTVTIYDYGRTPDGVFYYAMERLEGATLSDAVAASGPMPPARVVYVLARVADALAEAHGVGLIHRDIKPANIFLCRQGGHVDVPKVLDFGLVKELGSLDRALPSLTDADAITGTPHYMAPEALTDPDSVDHRVDLYALGAVGHFLLTGEHVFEGKTLVEVCGHHLPKSGGRCISTWAKALRF